jgi:hypothetical protein
MKELIQKVKNYVPVIIGAMTVDSYRRTVTSENISKRYENAADSLEQTNQKLENLYSELVNKKQSVSILDSKEVSIRGRIETLLEQFQKAMERKKQYSESTDSTDNKAIIEAIQQEAEKIVERLSYEVEELTITKGRRSLEIEDILNNISNDSNNQLLDNFIEN